MNITYTYTYILKSANRKSAISSAHSVITNPKISWVGHDTQIQNPQILIFHLQIAYPQISSKLFPTLSQKTVLKFVFLLDFLLCTNFNIDILCIYLRNLFADRPPFLSSK